MFTEKDFEQIRSHGLTVDKVESQIADFNNGFDSLPVRRAATPGDGITVTDKKNAEYYSEIYDKEADKLKVVKFVPASGAATRMFKELFEYVAAEKDEPTPNIEKLLSNIEKFAFYDTIKSKLGDSGKQSVQAVLDYGAALPKALILFHKYEDKPRTAVEEHLAEGAMYACSGNEVSIHFTISQEHKTGFEKVLEENKKKFEEKFGVRYNISFSNQKGSTDTIAVTPENEPFREEDGTLLFRPAGHGALIENLNQIKGDVIFIKNIDNVTPDHLKPDTVLYKKVIAGVLIALREKIFNYLNLLDKETDEGLIDNITKFVKEELCCELQSGFESLNLTEKENVLRTVLNRPIRVCGMVKNEGEPGGGPFWAENPNGTVSLQIAELAQIAPDKKHLLASGTHFNPVDLVCGVTDYKGNKFDLTKYTDPATGFISEKSKSGRTLKALELPGLWNGAMSNWNTIFVEVPVSTFTPVKEVTDLLRPQHQ